MGKAKGRRRIERGLVDGTVLPPPAKRFEPYREPSGDESRVFDLEVCRVYQGAWYARGRLTDFVVAIQVEVESDEWVDVWRIDCCHGEVHIHRFDAKGNDNRKVLRQIDTQDDVEHGYGIAIDTIYEQYEVALMRWNRGL